MKKSILAMCATVALAGCTQTSGSYYNGSHMTGGMYSNGMGQPVSGYEPPMQQQPSQPMYVQKNTLSDAQNEKISSEVNVMRERIRRLERAMVRLDRRMQLIERNELSRMTGSVMEGTGTVEPQGGFQPMSYNNALPNLQPVPTPSAQGVSQAGYQQVSYQQQGGQQGQITSSLGVAPKTAPMQQQAQQQSSMGSGLPSLADDANEAKDHNVAIWTINYENKKIWPSRKQLPSSRDVIESLNSGKPVALFARGANPSSREFRERVRAISKYLSKVTDIDNLPIASMSAKHLDGDTIELLATQ